VGVDAWGFDQERQAFARRLRTRRRWLAGARASLLAGFLVALLAGGSRMLDSWVEGVPAPSWARTAAFITILYSVGSGLLLPFAYVSGYRWEVEADLSSRTRGSWLRDQGKGFVLGLGATVLGGEVLLWLLATSPDWWWLAAWALGALTAFGLSILAPVLLVPMFFRSRPVQDPSLRSRIEALATAAGVPVVGVYELGASAKTRRSNAGVMGHGRTRRIVVTDTLLSDYSHDEIDAVLAHELGHEKFRDPFTGLVYTVTVSLGVAAAVGILYALTFRTFLLASRTNLGGLPVLALWAGLLSVATSPIDLWWSRRRERRADRFALELTTKPAAFASAIAKLHDKNLGVAHPTRWEVWLLYSHPSGRERVEAARAFAAS